MYNSNVQRIGMKRVTIVALMILLGTASWAMRNLSTESENVEIRPLSCVQYLQLSVGADGFAVITPQMLLADTFANYAPFQVSLKGLPSNVISCDEVNTTVMATVTDTRNGNSCWSNIYVEDKIAPEITCLNDTLPCHVDPLALDYSNYAFATDNCDTDVELWYIFSWQNDHCSDPVYSSIVTLEWTAEDDQGLQSHCISHIYFEKLSINNAQFPNDTTIYCPLPDTILAGEPTLDDQPINALCELFAYFLDDTMPGRCDGDYNIERTWHVMDLCNRQTVSMVQNISIEDTIAPEILCPDTAIVGTTSYSCTGLYVVPEVIVTDDCSEDSLIVVEIEHVGVGIVMVGDTIELDTGTHDFICTATDDCGNSAQCTHSVHVIDDVAPVLFCLPEIDIYLDTLGMAPELCIEDFDHMNHYFDNCGIDSIKIAKMVDFCDTTQSGVFGFCLNFCCEEVGKEVMIVIKVSDHAGNMNFCMINTNVLDTLPPVITHSPNDTSISCTVDYQDTSKTGGGIVVMDNCQGVLNIKITDSVDIDACKEGTVIRTFIACDPSGNADTAVQVITIFNDFRFDTSLVIWAQDTCIENCPVDSLPETIGSMTIVMDDTCDVVMVSYVDNDISDTADACLIIERTWTVRNECGDTVVLDSVQTITIKNYRAPILSGPPMDTTISAGADSCGAFVTLPELVATDCSANLIITNDCIPGDSALISEFFPVGEKTITFTAVDGCGKMSTYQVVITVTDDSGPALTCPPDTTINCEVSADTSNTGVATATDNCEGSGEIILVFEDDTTAGTCAQEFSIERLWTATDSSGNSSMCIQIIQVQDTTSPSITCPADVTLSCELPTDSGNTGVASATDNCDVLTVQVSERDSVEGGSCLNEQIIYRIWRAEDNCGNVSQCIQSITVVDTTAPTMVCPADITVECSDMTDPTFTGEPTITDNCDIGVITPMFQDSVVPRMGQHLRSIFRTWSASDTCGNFVSCRQVIEVIDTVAPTLICPPDITVGCDTSLEDLDVFGIPDTMDNCLGIILTQDTIYDLNFCNVGTVTRVFIAMDSVGNTSTCQQIITVALLDSLKEGDIIWPDSVVTVDACTGIDPDSIQVGRPKIDSSLATCFRVSVTYTDSVDYRCDMGVCSTVVRKWTVVDSCQMDTTGKGIFCFTQNISVVDTMPPLIGDLPMSDTVYLHPDSTCDAWFRIVADPSDCSGIKSITNNSEYGVDTFANASGRYPRGLTPVTFTVEDSCCNVSMHLILVFVLDTIPPVIFCRDVQKTILGEAGTGIGEAEFCVSELIATATDNCDPPLQLRASFDPNDPTDTCRTYNCDSLVGTMGMLNRLLTIYISDGSGNVTTCVSRITVIDRFRVCTGTIVGGVVSNLHGAGIENARVELSSVNAEAMTDENGVYDLGEQEFGDPYALHVTKDDDPLNGVSTKDIILIVRHLLGLQAFETPYEYIAADVNASNSIEVGDIVALRRLILGINDDLDNVPDWYFVSEQYDFEDIEHPLEYPWAFGYEIDSLMSDMDIRFIGVKPGDIDGSAKVNGLTNLNTRGGNSLEMSADLMTSDQGQSIELSIPHEISMSGLWFKMRYDDANIAVDKIRFLKKGGEELPVHWNSENGELKIIWTSTETPLLADEMIIQIDLSGKTVKHNPFTLVSVGERGSEILDQHLVEYSISLNESSGPIGDPLISELKVLQNKPNPFGSETVIDFFVPTDDIVTISISDASGRAVINEKIKVTRGWNQKIIRKQQLGNGGVYYYKIVASSGTQTLKMLVVD
jgi:hypothetical protein